MIHLGDITKINGAEIEPVDCITAGSPCQDLSVAGKRAGLEGERSGLFMEQIRIIKEMREHDRNNGRTDEFIRPRYMVWENVPGAFSSNKGEDFRCVLEETAKVAEMDAVIPGPPKGKWSKSGAIMGDGWSIAWRVHDAQFWGVPQRRKRIALVADFGGNTAPEILFERKSVSGCTETSGKEREEIATDLKRCAGTASARARVIESFDYYNMTLNGGIAKTLQSEGGGSGVNEGCILIENHPIDSRVKICKDNIVPTLSSRMGTGGNNVPLLMQTKEPVLLESTQDHATIQTGGISTTLPAYMGMGGNNTPMVVQPGSSVLRRLTPLECERLQGYPDGWTDIGDWIDSKGKKHKGNADSPRYKALGNSIALPFWFYLLRRISAQYERPATLGSLFDGIGGFPLCWERCNGNGTARWASEIEEFPIAVTKKRFGE